MATVTGLTAAKILELMGEQIIDAEINPANGHLVMQTRDGVPIDAGSVFRGSDFPSFNGGTADATKVPNFYPFGVTYASVGATGFPTAFGTVETQFFNENRALQRVTNKSDVSEVWVRTSAANVWGNWRLVGKTPGDITLTARATAPWGALIADGAAVSRTTYKELYAAIGTQFGAGDGSTTFNLPDLRGKVPFGISSETEFNVRGETGGAKTHTLVDTNIPQLPIASSDGSTPIRMTGSAYALTAAGAYNFVINGLAGSAGKLYANIFNVPVPVNHLPPYMALHYIIWT